MVSHRASWASVIYASASCSRICCDALLSQLALVVVAVLATFALQFVLEKATVPFA